MELKVTTIGTLIPVNYSTPQAEIFEFVFATASEQDIKKIDNHIERDGFFSFKTGKGIVFVGRMTKHSDRSGVSTYIFTVDNITLSRKLERFLRDQSFDVSTPG